MTETGHSFWYYHSRLLLLAAMLTVVAYVGLYSTDVLIRRYIPDFWLASSVPASTAVCSVFIYIVCIFGARHGWHRMLPYQVAATALIFPLSYLDTLARFYIGFPEATYRHYAINYCSVAEAAVDYQSMLCGSALSHMVFGKAVWALPMTVGIPLAFYFIITFNLFGLASLSRRVNNDAE